MAMRASSASATGYHSHLKQHGLEPCEGSPNAQVDLLASVHSSGICFIGGNQVADGSVQVPGDEGGEACPLGKDAGVGLAADINDLQAQTKECRPTCWSPVEATGRPQMLQSASMDRASVRGRPWAEPRTHVGAEQQQGLLFARWCSLHQLSRTTPILRASGWTVAALETAQVHLKRNVLSLAITVQPQYQPGTLPCLLLQTFLQLLLVLEAGGTPGSQVTVYVQR